MLAWIVGGLVVWAVGFAFVLMLMRMAGDENISKRERALGLIGEWTEVLSGRPEPATH